jgi:hypothetical protein
MGLGSSKESRELIIKASDVGVVRISEEAVNNIAQTVEIIIKNDNKSKVEEEKEVQIQIVEKIVPSENEAVLAARLEEYEKNLVNHFNKGTKDVEDMFRDRYKTTPICVDLQELVFECYKQNQKSSLKCLDISEKYIKCVENERLNRFNKPSSGT